MSRSHWNILMLIALTGCVQCIGRVGNNLLRHKRQGFTFDEGAGASDGCTFEGQQGPCIELKFCPEATTLLSSPSSANLLILQKMTCRFSGTIPFVCCVSEGSGGPPPTLPPVVTAAPATLPPPPVTAGPVAQPKQNIRDVCGFSNRTISRIVGGIPAQKDAWPWMAAIFIEDGGVRSLAIVSCGGALISDEFVATASHCVFLRDGITRRQASAFTIRFGDLDILSTNDNAQTIDVGVSEVIPHPGYNARTIHNDLALLRLKQLVPFSKSVRPICLPNPSLRTEDLSGFTPHIAGWGTLSTGGNSSNILRQVQVEIVTNEQCKQAYSRFKQTTIEPTQLCAGFQLGGKDACQGDSGGPLMLVRSERWTLIGVISFGFRCAEPGFPGVYTRTAEYLDWLLTNAKLR